MLGWNFGVATEERFSGLKDGLRNLVYAAKKLRVNLYYQMSFAATWIWREVVDVLVMTPAEPEGGDPAAEKTVTLGGIQIGLIRYVESPKTSNLFAN